MKHPILNLLAVLSVLVMASACDTMTETDFDPSERGQNTSGKADAPGSCEIEGEAFCSEQSPDGCWCDEQCAEFGDCCSDKAATCDEEEEEEEEEEEVACAGNPQYRVTLTTTWNPTNVPNPHWSPLVGAVHSADVDFWSVGGLASPGVEVMAETGAPGPFASEGEDAVAAGTAGSVLRGPGPINTAAGQSSVTFETNADFTLVTLTSMMAPSPDWFVGVGGVNLCPQGEWLEGSINMVVWDAGTDSGTNFTSPDRDTNPAQPISAATRFVSQGDQVSVGSMLFERIDN